MSATPGPLDVFFGNGNGRGLIRIETAAQCESGAGEHIASLARGKRFEAYALELVKRFNTHDATQAELTSLRAEVERLRTRGEALAKAMVALLTRIDSEPTMSGHLRGMRLRPDHGDTHKTSDAIRGAGAALAEWEKP